MHARHRWLTCFVIAGATHAAAAQTPQFAVVTQSGADGARGAVAVDLNRDGWLDVVVANTGRNTVAVSLNRGAAGGFEGLRETAVGAGPFDIAAGDIDRDGVSDLVVSTPDAATPAIEVLLMWPDGSLRQRTVMAGTGQARGLALADVTRDGTLDLIHTDYQRNVVVVRPGDGHGGFAAPLIEAAVGSRPQGVIAADFNHDGFVDLAVAATENTTLSVLYGRPSGGFTRRTVGAGRPSNVLRAHDLDGDGWLDIAAASTATHAVAFFRGGPGGFSLAGTRPTGNSPRGLALGDFNQDGLADLVVGNYRSGSVTLLAGRPGTVVPDNGTEWPAAPGTRALVAGDFNHDGRDDIVASAQGSPTLTILVNETTLVRPAFSFDKRPLPLWDWHTVPLAAADFNHNGMPDLVNSEEVLLDGVTVVRPIPRANHGVFGAAAADMNGDGHADIVYAVNYLAPSGHRFEGIEIYLGDGRGAFRAAPGLILGAEVREVAVADIDRDGRLDLVVRVSDRGRARFVVLIQADHDRTIPLPLTGWAHLAYDLPVSAQSMQLADLDRDGRIDALFMLGHPRAVEAWLGNGSGGFARGPVASLGEAGAQFALADLNHDGLLDIVTSWDRTIEVVLATGEGTWAAPVVYPASGSHEFVFSGRVLVGDFNHDGHPDVLSEFGGLLTGRGDGTLEDPVDFDIRVAEAIALDWNGDGLLDIVSASHAALNERRSLNRPPVADAGPDHTFGYHAQFDDEGTYIVSRGSSDPDAHRLVHEWRDEAGRLLIAYETGDFNFEARPPGTYTYTLTVRDQRGGEDTDTMRITILPAPEIVLHAASGWHTGHWEYVPDETAASGVRMFHPDAGAPKVLRPAAGPDSFVELSFTADPTQEYKLWIRLKAQNDHWGNDSLWVQFSGAVDPAGRARYRLGTSEGLGINLEECLHCGVSGWGWEDDGWGAPNRNGTLLRFPGGGRQRVVIQIREDGVSFDQIILSAERYRAQRPGASTHDTVILPYTQWW